MNHFKLLNILFMTLLLVSGLFINPSMAAKRTALVIGNSNYKASPLNNPVNDARDMATALRASGFNVTIELNASQRTMERAIRDFGKDLQKGGVGLFYYAGHGVQVKGLNYLIPVGSEIESEGDVKYECVDASLVLAKMEDARNDLNIVILDACRNNPFTRGFRSSAPGLTRMDAPAGSLIAYSTGPGSVAADGEGRNGLYTKHLLENIRKPGLKVEDVLKNVRIAVRSETSRKQTPWELSSLTGDFYFNTQKVSQPTYLAGGDVWTEPATGMEFVWVPGGCFQMGSNSGDSDEKPVHEVCVDGFWIGRYEVTQGQWKKIMGSNPSRLKKGDDYPVERVSWNDTKRFIGKLNKKNSGQYRFALPSEAQWEYAARSGGKAEKYSGGNNVGKFAWYRSNSGSKTHRVGTKAPNGLGIYDMSGNVWEWCEDIYAKDAYSKHQRNNPIYAGGGSDRVYRGGGWFDRPAVVRCANRYWFSPGLTLSDLGFRLTRLVK